MENPFGGDVDPRQAARMLTSTNRMASMLQQRAPGWGATPAEIICDIVNVQRADTKALADAHDVDVEIELMQTDRAAELVAGATDGDAVEIVEVFNELARQRDLVLREVMDEGEYRDFMRRKTSIMHTDDPDTWDVDLDEPDGSSDDDVAEAVGDVDGELEGAETVEDVQDALDDEPVSDDPRHDVPDDEDGEQDVDVEEEGDGEA